MDKKFRVLAVYYSQTGRTRDILDVFLEPLIARDDVELDLVELLPVKPFPYPWPFRQLLSIFPESVCEAPIPIEEPAFDENTDYDLIVLGCQVWFLSPSVPISSLLHHQVKSKVFANTPVVPVMTYRRSWAQGLVDLEKTLQGLNSRVVGKVVIPAKDKVKNPLFKAIKSKQLAEGEKEWFYDEQELERVGRMGHQLAGSLERVTESPDAPAFEECSSVFLPAEERGKSKESRMEEFVQRHAPAQKKKYLRWGKYIMDRSELGTAKRSFLVIFMGPLYFPKIYFFLPFLIIIFLVIALIVNIIKLPLLPFKLLKRLKERKAKD